MSFTVPTAFQSEFYYGQYGSAGNGLIDDNDRQALWDEYLALYYPDQGTSYTDEQLALNENYFIEGLFGAILKNFFYEYAPDNGVISSSSNTSQLAAAFQAYLVSGAGTSVTYKQNSVLLWLWQVLGDSLVSLHDAAPTKSGYALAMTEAELAAVNKMSAVSFSVQTSASDYGVSQGNMTKQKELEALRAWRGLVGKKSQQAQSMITTVRDNASQHSQLMASVMQVMQSLIQAVIKR